jgi:alkylation response protein AidB-like acyl-CoA dehydrogenase
MAIFALLAFLVILVALAYYRCPPKVWIPVATLSLFALTLLAKFSFWFLIVWLIFLPLVMLVVFRSFRLMYVTPFLLKQFQKAQPPMSKMEREALAAGDVWWEGELFCGKPNWQKLFDLSSPHLTDEERSFINIQTQTLCAMIDDWKIIQEASIPKEVWNFIKNEGFLGLVIDKKYGGKGFSAFAHSAIVSMISSRSASIGVAVMVPNALGTGEFIQHYGTEEQKNYYLPRLVTGEEIPAFALTSPVAGSDAASITDTGVVTFGEYQGARVLGIRLNWEKRYITLAPVATLLGLAFQMQDPEHLLGEEEDLGITACIVPTHLPGVEQGKRHYPAGLAFLNGPTRGKDVFIPLDFIIGGPDMRGKGWHMLVECLAGGRGISLPAMGTGMAKLSLRMTGAYAKVREQFRLPIGQLEGVAHRIGRMTGFTYLSDALREFTLNGIHGGVKPALPAAIAKYHVTEMSRQVIIDALDIHAGRGIQWGPRNYLAFLYQAIPVGITVEGANILTRNLMIFGQGVLRCHPYLRLELEALLEQDEYKRLFAFDQTFWRHIGYVFNNAARTLVFGLNGGRAIATPKHMLKPYLQQLTRMSTAFAFATDVVLSILGGELKRKECISSRFGDILSALFMASAVIKQFQVQGELEEDVKFVEWSLQYCLFEIQTAFKGLTENIKPRALGFMLYQIIFPWGGSYRAPSDALYLEIAAAMMTDSEQRDRLTQYCYIGETQDDPTGRMEFAFKALQNIQPLRAKLQAAIKQGRLKKGKTFFQTVEFAENTDVLTAEELQLLKKASALQWDAIMVDEFQDLKNSGMKPSQLKEKFVTDFLESD